ncbi:glycoside hydrolase family 2 [Virgibacillus sp. LDC1]|uniref:glycoside hydrolase family 2 protein n=1 Tax=Paenibacillus lautus TaxID=1401 RepID=UPI002DB82920|nr:glycoside hydrolase family 2 TIM barrel-domain containing protein [Paenibacillus lautus]MCV4230806.1 glycoside hydrolase family 2 [Virgibacillus sp. LDC1]MEC0258894.1 glycoside hydrolase family 2 TIM barrel-domain containing protein [Paenibacillus lautus]
MGNRLCLNGDWDFMPLYGQPQCRQLPEEIVYEPQQIQVPSSWRRSYVQANGRTFGEICEHGYAPMDLYGYPKEWDRAEAGVLHRSFQIPESMSGERIVLRMDGIMQKAVLFLDGEEVAVWEDGYLPLHLDITPWVERGHEHHLHVVCGSFDKVTLANGMVKVTGLMGSWFGNVARGIWQDVYLESHPVLSIEDVTIRTSVRRGRLELAVTAGTAEIGGEHGPLHVRLNIREIGVLRQEEEKSDTREVADSISSSSSRYAADEKKSLQSRRLGSETEGFCAQEGEGGGLRFGDGGRAVPVLQAEQTAQRIDPAAAVKVRLCENKRGGAVYRASFDLEWSDAMLWDPDTPYLYMAELELVEGEKVLDRREEMFGFREFWREGPQFMLNGIPIRLRGDSWHFQGGLQQTEAYIRNWYRMCRSVGINSIRLHAEPYPEDYVRIANEEGMLIIDETAIYGSGKSMLADHPDYLDNCRLHVQRLVKRDKNHPSVIMWSLQNEMRWVDGRDGYKLHIPGLMEAIRELDATRPIVAEGDNRLVSKAHTEVESRHYNIDGTIAQWDRSVPLTFGEHGGWWYICPQNASMYAGLQAYRSTDESTAGLAQKERLFVEYARRQGVSGIATFNFAHYFMRSMPENDVAVPSSGPGLPGVKPKVIPAYSLTINNGLLPEHPTYVPNPAFAIMGEAFKPVTMFAAEYNRCFYDDATITRSFDVFNDTLSAQDVRIECVIRQGETVVHERCFAFRQEPAEQKTIEMSWAPLSVETEGTIVLTAELFHGDRLMHELRKEYRLVSGTLLHEPVDVDRPAAYWGSDEDYFKIRNLVPGCKRVAREGLALLSCDQLLIIGSKLEDPDGGLEALLKGFVARGGRLLLLEQTGLSLGGRLRLSRRPFLRAHAGDYQHPVLKGLSDPDLMFWHEKLREEGPLPIIHAAFEKPLQGDFTLLLECSAGDFGDGGDLWTPLLEYRSGSGMFVANQLELMANLRCAPQACLLLRNLLAYTGRTEIARGATGRPVGALVRPGGEAAAFLDRLRLRCTVLDADALINKDATHDENGWVDLPVSSAHSFGLLVAEASLLAAPGAAEAVRRYAEAGGHVLVLPADSSQQDTLARLLDRPVRAEPHETYHLAADYINEVVRGFSPVDLFGYDKVFLSPRDVTNRPLASNRLEVQGTDALCVSIEGTAWKDYFANGYTSEYSRLALVELNRRKARSSGAFLIQERTGAGSILCSQLLLDPTNEKALRLYTRLLANQGAVFDDGLLESEKDDGAWAVEAVMVLPCPSHVDYEAMKTYYTDPEFSLNNLGEGLYGWMQKKERQPEDGMMRIACTGDEPWFMSCFVQVPGGAKPVRTGRLRVHANVPYAIYLNGEHVREPERELVLKGGLNRLIAIVCGTGGDIAFGMTFLHADGTYMKDLEYRMTLDEVEPK